MQKKTSGTIGFFKGEPVCVVTTRCFQYDREGAKQIRGVEVKYLNRIEDGQWVRSQKYFRLSYEGSSTSLYKIYRFL